MPGQRRNPVLHAGRDVSGSGPGRQRQPDRVTRSWSHRRRAGPRAARPTSGTPRRRVARPVRRAARRRCWASASRSGQARGIEVDVPCRTVGAACRRPLPPGAHARSLRGRPDRAPGSAPLEGRTAWRGACFHSRQEPASGVTGIPLWMTARCPQAHRRVRFPLVPARPWLPCLPAMDFEQRYRAVSASDSRFDGVFVTAVRSTGIYCRPSCPARTPLAATSSSSPPAPQPTTPATGRASGACRTPSPARRSGTCAPTSRPGRCG